MKRSGMPPRSAQLVARAALERGGPLERTARLERAGQLQRATPIPRPTSPPPKPRRNGSTIPEKVSVLVRARDAGCVRCAAGGHLERHHRCPKRMGGDPTGRRDVAGNLVLLCGWGNVNGCHGWVHGPDRAAAEHAGLLLPDDADWLTVPVLMHDGWWLLDDAGDRHPCEAPA